MRAGHTSHTSQYVAPLTGIRALAAFLVLGLHADQNVPSGASSLLPFLDRGYLGVDFFFVLSGFIITHVYLVSMARPNRRAILIFFWHRFIRLYPVHVAVLAGLVAVFILARTAGVSLNHTEDWRFANIPWHLTLLHAWGVTAKPGWNVPSWSISAEWFAYLLFPLLAPALMWVRERAAALWLAAAALTATALLFAVADWTLGGWVGAPALTRVFGEFLCGAALCRAVALSPDRPRPSGDLLGAGAFAAFLIGAAADLGDNADFALVVLLALTILGAATSRGFLARILGSPPLVWLGEISYSIYMVRFPVLIVIRRFWEHVGFAQWETAGKAIAFLATIALVVAIAAALFYLVERPARTRLRDRMGKLAPA